MKRIFCISFISIICCFSFLTGYCSLYSVPVYAAQDQWEDVTSNDEVVEAFRQYCKSRDITIDGSLTDAVTSVTTQTFNSICNVIGIDVTSLQAFIKKKTDSSVGIKFYLTSSGIAGFNRICAQFLQDNDISVGDTNVDKKIYSGEWYTDPDGNSCAVWVFPSLYNQDLGSSRPIEYGTHYKYTSAELYQFYLRGEAPFYQFSETQSDNVGLYGRSDNYYQIFQFSTNITLISDQFRNERLEGGAVNANGFRMIGKVQGSNQLYFGSVVHFYDLINPVYPDDYYAWGCHVAISNATSTPTDVDVTSPVVKPDLPETPVIILPDGSSQDPGEDDPDDPDQDDDWNPILPDVPPAGSDPSGGNTIDWPDLDLPDFGLSNFSLGDLRLKFPFSIPFDIVSILGVVNAPAVAPVIQEDIPIRIDLMNVDYTIPINLDMSDTLYDNFAKIVRAVEFIGFCIGLIHLTIRLVKG